MNDPQSPPQKAAIYLRISQDREMDGLAIERQRQDCERLAAFRGWDVVETYTDQSKSATDRTKVRKHYNRMVEDYHAGKFTAIVCYDLDRLARQPRQLEDWIDAAEIRGLALVTANGDADLTTDGGRMYARIKAAVARAEMERKSARQSAAQRQRATLGKPPKGMRPMGYTVAGDVIEDEAKVVEAIFTAFIHPEEPESLRSIARALSGQGEIEGIQVWPTMRHTVSIERAAKRKEEGLKPKDIIPDRPWSPSTVLGILRNPRYAGMSVYNPKETRSDGAKRRYWKAMILRDDAGEPIRGQWDAIIDDETWWRVQQKLDDAERVTNTSGSTKRKHLGSGLYRCHECGRKVTGAPRGYRCAGHVMRTGPAIDDFVTEIIARRLAEPDAKKLVPVAGDTPQARALSEAISEQRARILRAQRDYDDEIIEGHDLKRVREAAETRIADLENQRALSGRAGVLQPILGSKDPGQAFRDASLTVRREVVDILATVTLHPQPRGRKGFDPDSVEFVWRGDETDASVPTTLQHIPTPDQPELVGEA